MVRPWVVAGGVWALLLLVVRLQPASKEPTQYDYTIPPKAVLYRPLKLDSIGLATARCFDKPSGMVGQLTWYVSDSALGWSITEGLSLRAAGRYYAVPRAIVMQTAVKDNPNLISHEIRHHLFPYVKDHPDSIFGKLCP